MIKTLKTPPNERLIHEAEQQEARFCSLMLKHADCIAAAIEAGVQMEYFWTPSYASLYSIAARYFLQYNAILGVAPYRDICNKAAKEPEETTRRMQGYHDTYALHVTPDEFNFLKTQIIGRHAQRLVGTILEEWYQPMMTATSDRPP